MSEYNWRKSSHSGSNGTCVEVARLADGTTAVRDSKAPDGPILTFRLDEWAAFLDGVKAGEFDPTTA
jgi:hypothetical protein